MLTRSRSFIWVTWKERQVTMAVTWVRAAWRVYQSRLNRPSEAILLNAN